MPSTRAYIALGSNLDSRLGSPRDNIAEAIRRIGALPQTRILRHAQIRQTAPVGGPPHQPDFLNTAIEIETQIPATPLMLVLLNIEKEMGRNRQTEIRHGPRIIDLDLLLYGDLILTTPALTLPHPRLHERLFVLDPLCDLAPDFIHPILKAPLRTLRNALLK